MILSWLRRIASKAEAVRRDPFSVFPLTLAEKEAIGQRAYSRDWDARQKAALLALKGTTIAGWSGYQWAIDGGDDAAAVWTLASIPWIQFDSLHLRRSDGVCIRIMATQGNDNWPIACEEAPQLELAPGEPAFGIIGWRRLVPELPTGRVEHVEVDLDVYGAVIGIRLLIEGRDLVIKSGELMPDWNDAVRINFEDEFLLVQVDGRLPERA